MMKSREKDRPLPSPTYMSSEQMASYLTDLRSQRLSRPSGSRPPPPSKFASFRRAETEIIKQEPTLDERPMLQSSNSMPVLPPPKVMNQRPEPSRSIRSPFAGRPIARPLSALSSPQVPTLSEEPKNLSRPISATYMESGTRWMEKQEARSLRVALEDMDMEEDTKIHIAAQDEAAELVWKHKNPELASASANAPYPNPDYRKDYRSHLRKGSYQRSHSQDQVPLVQSRSSSGDSQRTPTDVAVPETATSVEEARGKTPPMAPVSGRKNRTPSGKSYGGLAEAVAVDIAKAARRTSSGSRRILSGEKKPYMNRNDRIWEDVQEEATPPKKLPAISEIRPSPVPSQPPAHIRKNPFARVRLQQDIYLDRTNSAPELPVAAMQRHSIDIQKNAPSQSKKPWYMSNEPLPPTPPSSRGEDGDDVPPKSTPTEVASKDGVEIRGDDIRKATSKQRKDRSMNLPQPTVVSDKPGRPIVSFKQDWKRKEVVLEEVHSAAVESPKTSRGPVLPRPERVLHPTNIPQIAISNDSKPPVPSINFPDDPNIPSIVLPDEPTIPSIVLPEEPDFASTGYQTAPTTPTINIEPPSIPTISVSGIGNAPAPPRRPAQRPLPAISRPQPHHAMTSPLPKSVPHYSPSVRQSGALCAHCALPIAGRILSAAGERFHPGCFVCHQCNTNLECVAFYPEPEKQRSSRLARIQARQSGFDLPVADDATEDDLLRMEAEDGDPGSRFYCHLDFHELFSPRCKSCKTPIEGEVIVACGAEWHAGHFFCAQCGDPFDRSTPFVEKDGYAWCVGCHTNRYSSKCRKCRKPVTDLVIKALGSDWHDKCFTCMECNGEFDDGRYFLRGDSQDPVCVRCEEKRLKA